MVGKERVSAKPGPWGCQPLRLVSVGPTTRRNQASDDGGGPAGPSAPTSPQRVGPANFMCEFPGCDRTFNTNRGRGLHHQKVHKDWYDARLQAPKDKARWTAEEIAMMARKEAELATSAAPPRFMNQELLRCFPRRTLEAIKSRRRRQDYKELVIAAINAEHGADESQEEVDTEDEPLEEDILNYLESLQEIETQDFQADRLQSIIRKARVDGKEATLTGLALYLAEVFPAPPRKKRARRKMTPSVDMNRRKARRIEYATTQELWKKDRRRCVSNILSGLGAVQQPPKDVMEPYWSALMTSVTNCAPPTRDTQMIGGIWAPITRTDLRWGRVPANSAAGPDGTSARLFKSVPPQIIIRIFNLLMWCGDLPENLLRSRTVFLPKKENPDGPGDFRPITIPPVLVRSLHKILAKRLETILDIDPRQRAFRSTDGCADNTFLLDTLLRFHRRKFRPLHMASLDVSKAFDSVSHAAIEAVLTNMGVPTPMVRYLSNVYQKSTTILEGDGWSSIPLHPCRGVRQGDPLSPIIFNMVTHQLLQKIPEDIGARLGDTIVNAVAFADDLMLFATTPMGLQRLIDITSEFLGTCGMTINSAKSLTLSIKASPHAKKTAIDVATTFTCNGQRLTAMRRSDEWRYLGIWFTPEGRWRCRPAETMRPLIDTLSRAPLKPQQRLYALRTMVIPKLYHQLALGAVTIGALNKTDKILRNAAKRWLSLPHDTPTAYFHAAVADGGLGVPSLRWSAPLQRRGRLVAAKRVHLQQEFGAFFQEEIDQCTRRLTDHGTRFTTPEMVNRRWRERLYASIDGAGLKESGGTPHQHQWIADATRFLSGKDYINCGRLRIGALPTRSRTSRGRTLDRRCRAGCLAQETLNHVLQLCHRTHEWRIKRHDAILNYMERRIRRGGYAIHREPHYQTTQGLRKPDLVAVLGQTAIVVDAQVVGEQADLEAAHRRKVSYYSSQEVVTEIRRKHGVQSVVVTSATLNWKGVWSPNSAMELRRVGFINTADLKILTSRVLVGGLAEFRVFNAATSWRWRTGVG